MADEPALIRIGATACDPVFPPRISQWKIQISPITETQSYMMLLLGPVVDPHNQVCAMRSETCELAPALRCGSSARGSQ